MHEKFRQVVESLAPAYERLMAMEPVTGGKLPRLAGRGPEKLSGVYLFSERGNHLYVGRSNHIKQRYRYHCSTSSKDGAAPFAYRLACKVSGQTGRSYVKGHPDTRSCKMADPEFQRHFVQAKERIKEMEFRFVIEPDPVRQAILEVYCAEVLETEFNSFDNR